MSTYSKLTYHIVFSTKHRRPLIIDPIRDPLYKYVGGVIRKLEGCLLEIGGVEDHVHLLTHLPAKISVSDCVRKIKSNSSKWANENPAVAKKFQWQPGYGGFTISHSQVDSVRRYIQNQREHHRVRTFKDGAVEETCD